MEPRPRGDEAPDGDQSPYLTGYGLGIALVALVNCLSTSLFSIPGNPAGTLLNICCLLVFLAATAASAVRIVRGTHWQLLATTWIVALLGVSGLLRSALPADQLASVPDWSSGSIGFVALAVALGKRVLVMVGVLIVNGLIGLVGLVRGGLLDLDTLVRFGSNVVGISVFPLAGAVFYLQLKRVVLAARQDRGLQQQLVIRAMTARRLADDRAERTGGIEATIVPLLQSLADGGADPQDPGVRTAARIESARMRRMFAEVDEVDEPMVHEVGASMDAVERVGVAVALETRGEMPALPVELRRALLEAPMSALASASSTARVVIIAEPRTVSVSVVTDGPPGPRSHGFHDLEVSGHAGHIQTLTTTAGDVTWTRTTWTATP